MFLLMFLVSTTAGKAVDDVRRRTAGRRCWPGRVEQRGNISARCFARHLIIAHTAGGAARRAAGMEWRKRAKAAAEHK